MEQDHCGQFSYPTIQYVPTNGMVFVAYTVLFLPGSMPPDCKVRRFLVMQLVTACQFE